ncbi:MAG: acylneuraminate cytidylyltransferase, partial [Armatimonadetes bacterium]|nr:acylneuraminate cytidylyltransferase [Armatimonadota bacterium]
RFPGMKRTTWKLRAGTFTGGNIVLMNTKLMRQSIPKLNEAYANRKNVLKIAKMLGFSTLVQFAIGKKFPKTMVIERLEKSVGRFLGGPIKVVITKFAEIGADIDSAEQYNQLKNFE